MIIDGTRRIAIALLISCTPLAVCAQPPEQFPEPAQTEVGYGEGAAYDPPGGYDTSRGYRGGSRLSRWWHGSAKPCLQSSHWGYAEYFEEVPFGVGVTAVHNAQICNGWAARQMLYHYDFCDGAASLNLHGQRRLNEFAASYHIQNHYILRVEATPGSPRLDQARRDYVAKVLADAGVPTRVEISYPAQVSPFGDETRIVNENLLDRVRSGEPIRGTAGVGGY
jgi:hypothetical protein